MQFALLHIYSTSGFRFVFFLHHFWQCYFHPFIPSLPKSLKNLAIVVYVLGELETSMRKIFFNFINPGRKYLLIKPC